MQYKIQKTDQPFRQVFRYCFFTLFLFFSIYALGHHPQPKLRHFDVNDGLPSATVYHVFQDSKDYIWFSSEAGLTRFDGVHVTTFSMDEGLPGNELFGVYEDSKGRIWTKCYNGKFAYIQNNKVFNEQEKPYLKYLQRKDWISKIQEDIQGNIIFTMQESGVVILSPTDSIISFSQSQLSLRVERYLESHPSALQPAAKKIKVLNSKALTDNATLIFTNIGTFTIDPVSYELEATEIYATELARVDVEDKDNVWAVDGKNTCYFLNKKGVFQSVNLNFTSKSPYFPFHFENKKRLWLASLGNGVSIIDNWQTTSSVTDNYLAGESISWMMKDREGNYWFTTLGKGVYMLPSNTVLTYSTEQALTSNDLYSVAGDEKGNIYIGSNGAINIINKEGYVSTVYTHGKKDGYNRITKILTDQKGKIWVGSDLGITTVGGTTPYKGNSTKNIAKDNNGNIYIGDREKLVKIKANNQTEIIWKRRTTAIQPEDNGVIWIGGLDGLHYYGGPGQEIVDLKKQDPIFGYRISDLAMTQDSILCLCTFGNGIIFKDKEENNRVTTKNGLIGNTCKDIFVDNNNNIWVSTNAGVSRFKVNKSDLSISPPINYSESDNLASNDIRGVFAQNGNVWVATSEGLSYFTETEAAKENPIAPKIYITGFKIGDSSAIIQPTYTLPHHQNNITITYTGLSFKSGNRIRYEYKRKESDPNWVISELNESQFPDLDPGTYNFLVKAISVDNIESEEYAKVTFTIKPPWWRTTLFYILSALSIIGLVSTIVYYIIENNKQKNQLKQQIVESEQMALRAQMNPHFIFNALNSIQHFITMEDEVSANYYLSKFSKLVRQVLENSKKRFIYLTEEIETLELYLALEMLRFDGKFEYEIEVDDDINTYDIEIPSMIIQPFVENAIWHGLMPKEDNPKLTISFEENENFLVCKVEDNGIGREASAKINQNRSAKHQSTGIDNTTKRLDLLSNVKHTEPFVTITDLKNGDQPTGTLVTILIPHVFND